MSHEARNHDEDYAHQALYWAFIENERPDGRPRIDHFLASLARYGCEVVPIYKMDQWRRRDVEEMQGGCGCSE